MEERDPVLRNGEDPDFLLELTSALHSVSVPADRPWKELSMRWNETLKAFCTIM